MTEEEKILLNNLKSNEDGYIKLNFVQRQVLIDIIDRLQKELEQVKEKNEKLEGQIENLMQTIRENTNAEDLLKEN